MNSVTLYQIIIENETSMKFFSPDNLGLFKMPSSQWSEAQSMTTCNINGYFYSSWTIILVAPYEWDVIY